MSTRASNRVRAIVGLWAALVVAVGSCAPPGVRPGPSGGGVAGGAADGASATGASADATTSAAAAVDGGGIATAAATAGAAKGGRTEIALTPDVTEGALVLGAPKPVAAAPDAAIEVLSDDATRALLARLEPLPELAAAKAAAPSLRPPSAMPARPGAITPIAMIGPGGAVIADAPIAPRPARPAIAPLAPPEVSPQGEVRAESEIRVRFGEAMVPVAAVGPPASAPATISPAVAGAWRWIDSRVAVFTAAAPRLPQATEYVVTVPAGTRALSGAVLAATATARFTTAAPRITSILPRGSVRPDSAIAVTFDQRIDPAVIARSLRVQHGRTALPFRVVTRAEAIASWRRNPVLADHLARLEQALAADHVLLAPTTAWPAGSEPRVILAAGAPSAEGPRTATAESAADFDVAPAFAVRGIACGRSDRVQTARIRCPAGGALDVQFSNEVAASSFRAALVQLEGEPFQDTGTRWGSVWLSVPPGAGRSHAVVIGDGLRDVYDQPLTGRRRLPFTTGREELEPWGEAPSGLIVLDPRFAFPQWIVQADAVASVKVELYAVTPADYFAYAAYEEGERPAPPGRRVLAETFPVGARRGVKLRIDLRPALAAGGLGHVIAQATFAPAPGTPRDVAPEPRRAWIQVTRLGIAARFDGDDVHAWVQDLTPGRALAPVAGAAASITVDGLPAPATGATTDDDGHATFALLPPDDAPGAGDREALLQVQAGGDATFAVIDGRYRRALRKDEARWYVSDDRFLYKPGEEVRIKGWVRWTDTGKNPDLALPRAGEEVSYQLTDARGVKLAAGTARFTDQGGFDAALAIPATANLGQATIALTTRDSGYRHAIRIEEFRPPAFAVTLDDDVTHRGATPLYAGEELELSAGAGYYAGGGLPGARVDWDVGLTAASYRPPGWDDYGFAPLEPGGRAARGRGRTPAPITAAQRGALDPTSAAGLTVGVPALPLARPSILAIDATVIDVDRTAIRASSRPILVHPARYYVGVRARPGERGRLAVIVTDVDGEPVPGVAIDVALEGVLGSERHRDDAVVVDTQRCRLTSERAPVICTFTPMKDELAYDAIAEVRDGRGRRAVTRYPVPWWTPPDRVATLAVVPDRASYRPGDVARLEVRSTVVPATAILSLARRGVIEQRRLELLTPTTIVEVAIADGYLPGVHVIVDRWGARTSNRAPAAGPLPGHDQVEVELPVDLEGARLIMRTRATEPLVAPGAPATFEVEVRHDDRPVAGAEVALMVVDEAILALTEGSHADPLPGFHRKLPAGTWSWSTLRMVQDAGPDVTGGPAVDRYDLAEGGFGFGRSGYGVGGGGGGYGTIGVGRYGTVGHGAGGAAVAARKDFRATAVFSPALRTDADGKARLTVTMPDSLTRFRVVALATARTRWFGKAEGTIVTQRKLNARTVAPRFLTQGDRFWLPVVVQNLERTPRTIDVAVRAANLAAIGASGRRVTVGGGQRAEVRFELATAGRGPAVIQTIAVAGDDADAAQVKLPVYEPATTEAFATYGTVDGAAAFERLEVPADLYPDVGGVEVELASTQLQELTDAYGYLYAYPYECAEQRSARMLATAAMADVLDAFAVPGRPTRPELDERIALDLRALEKTQLADGSWGYWPGMDGDPFVTMQVLRALVAHRGARRTIERATAYVDRLTAAHEGRLAREAARAVADRGPLAELPYDVGLAATGLATLAAAGVDAVPRALRLHASATALAVYPIDAQARLLAIAGGDPRAEAMRAELTRALVSATHETAAVATVTACFVPSERLLLVSENRTTALALDALLREAPDHPLVTKLARGLLAGRRRGRWMSTQENLAVLAALRRYFDVHEAVTPDFTGRLWFGSAAYAERRFAGRETARATAALGWPALVPGSGHDLAIAKEGAGRLYYRVGIRYAPRRADLPPLDAGFIVRRSYAAIDDPADVERTAAGWRIRLGARVRVTVETLNTAVRYGVAVVDPIPAGFETINEALAIAERVDDDPTADRWDHRNLRDDRSEAFAMELAAGSHRFSYAVRAATPGSFLAAPARAEEMYMPETFGRSAGATVEIR